MRPSRIVVDLDAITANVAAIVDFVNGALVCPAVKADGYGHGDVPVAEAAIAGGAERLSVATVEEGIRLREAGIEVPILLLSEPSGGDVNSVLDWNLIPTVYSPTFIAAFGAAAKASASGSVIPVHLKVDTGMHRVGAALDDALETAEVIVRHESLDLEGVWSHLAVADSDPAFTSTQRHRFLGVVSDLTAAGIEPRIRHLANTAGIFSGPEFWFEMVRPGIGIYGLTPRPAMSDPIPLVPALRLESAVSHVARLLAGERPSYGRRRPLTKDSTVVTVPIGYADGYGRGLNDADVLIDGRRFPLAGAVTMDQIMIDVGDADIRAGAPVVLIGRQGSEEITATELAAHLGTINYEVVARLGPRLRRVYEP